MGGDLLEKGALGPYENFPPPKCIVYTLGTTFFFFSAAVSCISLEKLNVSGCPLTSLCGVLILAVIMSTCHNLAQLHLTSVLHTLL